MASFVTSRIVQRSVARFRGTNNALRRSVFTATSVLQETHQIMVPTMGDSITEGTIVEWTTGVGQAVKEGDVVALVETDKVTVDIKAEMDGVIVNVFGEVDETVEVGSKLYELDTEATATAVASSEAGAEEEKVEASPAAVMSSTTASATMEHGRTPSIHFLGKDGWASRLSGNETATSASKQNSPTAAAAQPSSSSPKAAITLDGSAITSNYGRLPMTEKEMEALLLGGAETAPSLVSPSGPAMFAPA